MSIALLQLFAVPETLTDGKMMFEHLSAKLNRSPKTTNNK